MSDGKSDADPHSNGPSEGSAVEGAANQAIGACMRAIDSICHNSNLGAAEMIFVSNIVASQLVARTLFFVDGPEARAKLKRDSEEAISGTLENACRHLTQSEQEMKSRIIMPN